MSWGSWTPAPLVLVGAGVTLQLFALGFRRLRLRGRHDHAPWWRGALFIFAVVLGTIAVVSPLDTAADSYLLSAHMLQHVIIADVVPALLLVAVRGPLVFFVVPKEICQAIHRSKWSRAAISRLLRPRVSLTLWAGVFAAWHVPVAYDFALDHEAVHDLEHLTFVLVGLLAWSQVIDPARRNAISVPQRLACAGVMLAVSLTAGAVLLIGAPLYPSYVGQTTRLFGFSPALDQQLAGAVMIVEQLAAFSICAAILLTRRRSRVRASVGYEPRPLDGYSV